MNNSYNVTLGFVFPTAPHFISSSSSSLNASSSTLSGHRRHRPCFSRHVTTIPNTRPRTTTTTITMRTDSKNSNDSPASARLSWPKVLLLTAGAALSTTFGMMPGMSRAATSTIQQQQQNITTSTNNNKASLSSSTQRNTSLAPLVSVLPPSQEHNIKKTPSSAHRSVATSVIPLDKLGIKREEFLSDRELRRRKTTQFSEAEQEIMELEEWEIDTQWFRDLQTMWAAIASIGGIYVLYKGGVMWENWIKEQEKKDMEEEIQLTGKFVDPRAVRKDEDDGDKKKKGVNTKKPSGGPKGKGGDDAGGGAGPTSDDGDFKQGDIESLEKLFGKS